MYILLLSCLLLLCMAKYNIFGRFIIFLSNYIHTQHALKIKLTFIFTTSYIVSFSKNIIF